MRRAWLGIAGGRRAVAPRVAAKIGYQAGIAVAEVVEGSPAEQAEIRPDDIIVAVDDHPVADAGDLQRLMIDEAIGRPMAVRVVRRNEPIELRAVPSEMAA